MCKTWTMVEMYNEAVKRANVIDRPVHEMRWYRMSPGDHCQVPLR